MGPQCEDGYTKVANELLDALCLIRIPGESMQIFLTILRKTYGYGKKEDRIALSQFVEATGVSKTHVLRAIDKLVDMNIVTKNGKGYIVSYGINKIYQEWKPLPKKGTFPKKGIIVPNKGNKRTPKRDIQKKKEKKETVELLPICAAWKAFVEMRKKINKPMTDYAMKLRVKDLVKFMEAGHDPIEVLNQSVCSCWQDLYAVKEKKIEASLPKQPYC